MICDKLNTYDINRIKKALNNIVFAIYHFSHNLYQHQDFKVLQLFVECIGYIGKTNQSIVRHGVVSYLVRGKNIIHTCSS